MKTKPLERLRLSQTARPVDVVTHWKKEGYLYLDPPYQRGEVWGEIRRVNLIRSLLLGVPIPSIIINDRMQAQWKDDDIRFAVIDGKQRIGAILGFMEEKFSVPGEWFGMEGKVLFSEIELPHQRRIRNTPIQFFEGVLPDIESEREVFELVNFGGVPQGESDLAEKEASHG